MDTNLSFVSYLPHHLLRSFIDYYWVARSKVGSLINRSVNVFPITMHTLIFFQGDTPLRFNGNIQPSKMPRICMIGMVIQNDQYLLLGNVHFIAVRFKPLGLYRLLNLAPSDFANENIDFELYGSEIKELYNYLLEAKNDQFIVRELDGFFLKKLCHFEKKDRKIIGIRGSLDSIYKTNGIISMKKLRDTCGLSERGFRKSFINTVGISPKLYSRIIRFNTVLQHIMTRRSDIDLFDLIEMLAYYDQSHFLKEFKSFTGSSFTQFKTNFQEFDELHRKKNVYKERG